MNQRNVGKVHSNVRSQVRNHGTASAARAQNPSGSRSPSSRNRRTAGVTTLTRISAGDHTYGDGNRDLKPASGISLRETPGRPVVRRGLNRTDSSTTRRSEEHTSELQSQSKSRMPSSA